MSGTGTLSAMPAPDLVIPDRGEQMFPVRMREWARLKEKVDALKRHKRQWANAGWALVGVGGSALLSWLPYMLTGAAHQAVAVWTIVIAITTLVAGLLGLTFSSETQKSIDDTVRQAKIHMFDMESGLSEEQRKQIAAMAAAAIDL